MREFVASVMLILGCTVASSALAGERAAPVQGPQGGPERGQAVAENEFRPGLKRSLSGTDQAYQRRMDDRARLSVEERAVISRELRQVLQNVYEADRSRGR